MEQYVPGLYALLNVNIWLKMPDVNHARVIVQTYELFQVSISSKICLLLQSEQVHPVM